MYGFVLGLFLVVAIALVFVILMQQGKGAVLGSSFGAGASNTVFGASGSGNFLTRATTILAIVFFTLALIIGAMTSGKSKSSSGDDIFADDNAPVPVLESEEASDVPVSVSSQSVDVPVSAVEAATDVKNNKNDASITTQQPASTSSEQPKQKEDKAVDAEGQKQGE